MPPNASIQVSALSETELAEADRIVRVAFGTFLGFPNPEQFMGDRTFMVSRWRSAHVKVIAARDAGRLIGSNVVTRWGSFGFFGPLTVLPEYWDRGVAQRLLAATMTIFERWEIRHAGLFTFAHSAKHVGLYQKFGFWPRYLTAIMKWEPIDAPAGDVPFTLLSTSAGARRKQLIEACARLTNRIHRGLDLTGEVQSVLKQHIGDVIFLETRGAVDAFAICLTGPGSEGGEKTCYVKFAAARGGSGAAQRFERLLDACQNFARSRGVALEAGVNLARAEAYQIMRAHGFKVVSQGVAMQRPHKEGFNRAGVFVIDDWR